MHFIVMKLCHKAQNLWPINNLHQGDNQPNQSIDRFTNLYKTKIITITINTNPTSEGTKM